MALLQMRDLGELQESCKDWVEEALASQNHVRESKWTESIAVGSEQFVETTKEKLGIKAKGRQGIGENGTSQLKEPATSYQCNVDPENERLRLESMYFWNDIV